MKNIGFFLFFCSFLFYFSCQSNEHSQDLSSDQEPKAAVLETKETEIDQMSIYHLPSEWTSQEGKTLEFKDLKGEILVVVMIYTSCKAACPRLVSDMRSIEQKVSGKASKKVKYVLVSIDPEVDTPERLKAFAKENEMDSPQWLFLRGTKNSTLEFANILAVKYKEISPMDFSHSNIISVFDENGVMQHQQEGLGVDNKETVEKILALSK